MAVSGYWVAVFRYTVAVSGYRVVVLEYREAVLGFRVAVSEGHSFWVLGGSLGIQRGSLGT